MAKLNKGILGPISGKLGPIVGASWKGIPYLRSAPKLTNKTQRTAAQLASQYKFKFLHQWLIPFHPYINNGFKHAAMHKTEINAAFTANYKAALVGTYPNFSIDYSKVQLSAGHLPLLERPTVSRVNQSQLLFTWEHQSINKGSFNDQLMVIIYSPELAKIDGFIGGVKRVDLQCIFAIDQKLIGQDLEIYVVLMDINGKKVSNTLYLGRLLAL